MAGFMNRTQPIAAPGGVTGVPAGAPNIPRPSKPPVAPNPNPGFGPRPGGGFSLNVPRPNPNGFMGGMIRPQAPGQGIRPQQPPSWLGAVTGARQQMPQQMPQQQPDMERQAMVSMLQSMARPRQGY